MGTLMIVIIWGAWLINIIIGTIMLLNFLIAIISESYAEVLDKQKFYRYQHKCEINLECLIFF